MLSKRNGFVLIITLSIMAAVVVIGGIVLRRVGSETKLIKRYRNSLQALEYAHMGINYVYGELHHNFYEWNTHQSNGNPAVTEPVISDFMDDFAIIDANGYFSDSQGRFSVVVYPDPDHSEVDVIQSIGTSGGVQRTIEYRISRKNLYEYFFFFPEDKIFDDEYDCGNAGKGIHVKGDAIFDHARFTNIPALTAEGYFRYFDYKYQYPAHYDRMRWNAYKQTYETVTILNGESLIPHVVTAPYEYYLPNMRFKDRDYFFTDEDTYVEDQELPSDFPGAFWQWDVYEDPETHLTEPPTHYMVYNPENYGISPYDALHVWAMKEKTTGPGAVGIFATQEEYDAYNYDRYDDITEINTFWQNWITTNNYDLEENGQPLFEWKYWRARFNWDGEGAPPDINAEWFEDLFYGNDPDILDDGKVPVDYLNSRWQETQWDNWLSTKDFTEKLIDEAAALDPLSVEANFKKVAQEQGIYVRIGEMTAEEYSPIYQEWHNTYYAPYQEELADWSRIYRSWCKKRYPGGVIPPGDPYDGSGYTIYEIWLLEGGDPQPEYTGPPPPDDHIVDDPIEGATTVDEENFYNPIFPASSTYGGEDLLSELLKTRIVSLDIADLTTLLDANPEEFEHLDPNHLVIYFDLTEDKLDLKIKNGVKLPPGFDRVTIVTNANCYIQGDFNLDGSQCSADADFPDRQNIDDIHGGDYSDYAWAAASVISLRRVYNLSNEFNPTDNFPMPKNFSVDYAQPVWEQGRIYNGLQNETFLMNHCEGFESSGSGTFHYTDYDSAQTWINALDPTEQEAMLIWGNNDYKDDFEGQMVNRVTHNLIQNLAIVSPNDPRGWDLERWDDHDKTVRGSFIQLPVNQAEPVLWYMYEHDWEDDGKEKWYVAYQAASEEERDELGYMMYQEQVISHGARIDPADAHYFYETRFSGGTNGTGGYYVYAGVQSSWRELTTFPLF